ncbi:MAG TPA: hypothetical protein VJ999_12925 [Candidatus Sulfotelmatobacter sp.]|nr:hypothetical protein [Candidatus Sulfotelmatobacter sp.]
MVAKKKAIRGATLRKGKSKRKGAAPALANVLLVNMIPQSLSAEENQDSEPCLAVNPANPQQIVATAFTPDPMGGPLAPVYLSNDGGNSWSLQSIIPSQGPDTGTGDITVGFGQQNLYSGILKLPGDLLFKCLAGGESLVSYANGCRWQPTASGPAFCARLLERRQRHRLHRLERPGCSRWPDGHH